MNQNYIARLPSPWHLDTAVRTTPTSTEIRATHERWLSSGSEFGRFQIPNRLPMSFLLYNGCANAEQKHATNIHCFFYPTKHLLTFLYHGLIFYRN